MWLRSWWEVGRLKGHHQVLYIRQSRKAFTCWAIGWRVLGNRGHPRKGDQGGRKQEDLPWGSFRDWQAQWWAPGGAVLHQPLRPHTCLGTTPQAHPLGSSLLCLCQFTTTGGRRKLEPFGAGFLGKRSREALEPQGWRERAGQVVPPYWDPWPPSGGRGLFVSWQARRPLPPSILSGDRTGNPIRSLWANCRRKSPVLSIKPRESPSKALDLMGTVL